jgi:hypothetical protein
MYLNNVGGRLIVLLFGAPGSGKGTQARFISERRKIPAISTGDMLREEIRNETALGKVARSILAKGQLVDDDLVNIMVVHRITQPDCRKGFILERPASGSYGDPPGRTGFRAGDAPFFPAALFSLRANL